jgi:hypothetical protein
MKSKIHFFEASDQRVVCGVQCTWWDDIDKVTVIPNRTGSHGKPLPGCPHCHSPLFQVPSKTDWWKTMLQYELRGHHGYTEFIWWLRGRCFPNLKIAVAVYETTTGKKVNAGQNEEVA